MMNAGGDDPGQMHSQQETQPVSHGVVSGYDMMYKSLLIAH